MTELNEVARLLEHIRSDIDHARVDIKGIMSLNIYKWLSMLMTSIDAINTFGNIEEIDYDSEYKSWKRYLSRDQDFDLKLDIKTFDKLFLEELVLFFYENVNRELEEFIIKNISFEGDVIKRITNSISEYLKEIVGIVSAYRNVKTNGE